MKLEISKYGLNLGEEFEYHIKNKNYNYYRLNKSKQTVLDIFDAWKSSNPMISVGGYTSQFMDKVKDILGHINLETKHFNYGI